MCVEVDPSIQIDHQIRNQWLDQDAVASGLFWQSDIHPNTIHLAVVVIINRDSISAGASVFQGSKITSGTG